MLIQHEAQLHHRVLLNGDVHLVVPLVELSAAVYLRAACRVNPVLLDVLELYAQISQNTLEQKQIHCWL